MYFLMSIFGCNYEHHELITSATASMTSTFYNQLLYIPIPKDPDGYH